MTAWDVFERLHQSYLTFYNIRAMTNNDFKHRAQRDMFYELVHQAAKSLSMAQKLSLVMTQTDPTTKDQGRIIGDIKTVLNDLHTKWAYDKKEEENKNNWLLEFLKKRDEETTPDL